FEVVVQGRERGAHAMRGPYCPQGVVLMEDWNAEDRHDRVADELLDGPPVLVERPLHRPEIAAHDPAERLGVELLAETRRGRNVAEDDRDGLALLGVGL